MQIAMGAARLGVLTNFLSQPVLSGFTSAAAFLIALSQVKHLLGVPLPADRASARVAGGTGPGGAADPLANGRDQHRERFAAARISIPAAAGSRAWKTFPAALAQSLSKSGPIVVVIVGTAIVAAFHLGARNGVSIIGEIPSGLPRFALPALAASEFLPLIPLAFTVSFIGFLENISVAKSLAAKRRQKVDSNQEFIALGAANLAAGVTGGYPVSGSFARSTVNFTAGANTGLASLITVAVVAWPRCF
jgi:sulfate permease, SulP family